MRCSAASAFDTKRQWAAQFGPHGFVHTAAGLQGLRSIRLERFGEKQPRKGLPGSRAEIADRVPGRDAITGPIEAWARPPGFADAQRH